MAAPNPSKPAGKARDAIRPLASNRRALHEYHVLDSLEAGIRLKGTEVKAVREGRVQLKDSYVDFKDGQAWLVGAHISAYSHGNRENHDPEQLRKLLLKKREIDRLFGRTQLKGLTVVPLSVYLKGNWIKVEIALVQGKKLFDKRESEKTRELDREAEAAVKSNQW
jgi:SsrA-binding protein